MKEIVYIEHRAGVFEDGLQICVLCGIVLVDYTDDWLSTRPGPLHGWPEGPLYRTGVNPVVTMIEPPLENFGRHDPYTRVVKKCVTT